MIPEQRLENEVESVAVLMPLRVNLKKMKLPIGKTGYLPLDWDNKNHRPFYIRKALNKLHSFKCVFGDVLVIEKDYSFVNFYDDDDEEEDEEIGEDALVEVEEKDDLLMVEESKVELEAMEKRRREAKETRKGGQGGQERQKKAQEAIDAALARLRAGEPMAYVNLKEKVKGRE